MEPVCPGMGFGSDSILYQQMKDGRTHPQQVRARVTLKVQIGSAASATWDCFSKVKGQTLLFTDSRGVLLA